MIRNLADGQRGFTSNAFLVTGRSVTSDGDAVDHRLVDHRLADGDTVELGTHEYDVLHTPGHKEDHVCLHSPDAGVLFAADLVFAGGSFGRTDLPEGDRDVLVESIDRVLETVGPGLRAMHTGHGPSVTDDPYSDIKLSARAARRM